MRADAVREASAAQHAGVFVHPPTVLGQAAVTLGGEGRGAGGAGVTSRGVGRLAGALTSARRSAAGAGNPSMPASPAGRDPGGCGSRWPVYLLPGLTAFFDSIWEGCKM